MRFAFRRLVKSPLIYRVRQYSRTHCRLNSAAQPKVARDVKSLLNDYYPGKRLHGFTVKEVQEVPEFCLTAVRLTHDSTGADYLHVARDDHNNAFSVGFRTTPMNSTGVPHILEHTVLCGSEKYPTRDPFFKMLNRSLATYMNALTSCDYTMYPFSTQNVKDFHNLMSVYLDAVFHPCLRELDFSQEGWRLEHKDVKNSSSDIIFKGIVFNEMKGAFANSDQLFAQCLQNKLLPDHTYAYVSGGDPLSIPDLTWDHLCKFHASHYHPSNARFYTYGDFPLEGHLICIDEHLKKFTKISIDTSVPRQNRWNEPHVAHINCRPDPLLPNPEKNMTVCISYLLHDINDISEKLTMQIISELLVSGPNSPFYKNLLAPQIGSNYSPVVGIDGSIKEAIFSVGLQGIHSKDLPEVTTIIEKTFDEVIISGFPNERIEAFLHRIELAMKHVSTGFGLQLNMGLMPTWIHDGNPIEALKLNMLIQNFRKNLKEDPTYLQKKVEKYFKQNKHRLTLIMSPAADFEERQNRKEQEKLAEKISHLTIEEKEKIYEKGLQLTAKQNQEEDVSCLPTLHISDIDRVMKFTELNKINVGDVPVQICIQPTNGVTYFRGILDTSNLSPNLKPYLPLFCHVLTKLGAGDMDYMQLDQKIELKTGGLSIGTHVVDRPSAESDCEEGIRLYSHCLDQNIPDMFWLWNEIFNGAKFDEQNRLATLISVLVTDTIASIPDVGHSYAVKQASSTLSKASHLREMYSGMKQVAELRKVAGIKNMAEIVEKLQQIAQKLLNKDKCRFALNTSKLALSNAQKSLEDFVAPLRKSQLTSQKSGDYVVSSHNSYYVLPLPVHYVSKCIRGVPFSHPDFASLNIAAQLMTNKFLHREIREKGGAYGGGANHGAAGIFTYYSYRDPNSLRTLETFDRAIEWVQSGNFDQQHLDEAKLTIFQTVDGPIAPGDKGATNFINGIDDTMLQKHREQLFAATKSDLINSVNKYLAKPKLVGTCILGPENSEIVSQSDWKIISDYKEL